MHTSEIAYVLMPPVLAGWLLWRRPRTRSIRLPALCVYAVVMFAAIGGVSAVAAHVGKLRIKWVEIGVAFYFAVGWRLAWEVWRRTVGRLAESRRRRARRRRGSAPGWWRLWRLLPLARAMLTLTLFVPLFLGAVLTHRFKFGDGQTPADAGIEPFEAVAFRTADGLNIAGWFVPEPESGRTVVICHGAGANKGNFLSFVLLFHRMGYNSLIFDFRAHGDSDGHTTSYGVEERHDVAAAVRWLQQEHPDRCRHVLGLGSSMGAAALLGAAVETRAFDGLVLDSCFRSAGELVDHHLGRLGWAGRAWGKLLLASMRMQSSWGLGASDAARLAGRLEAEAVLVICGERDRVVPREQGEEVFRRIDGPKARWVGGGSHSNVVVESFEEYQRRVIGFFDRCCGGPPGGQARPWSRS